MAEQTPPTALAPRQVVEQAYAAAGSGDGAAFAALLADDVVLEEPAGHPFPGIWHGKEEVLGAFPGLLGALGLQNIEVKEIVADGQRVFAMIDMICTSKSGERVVAPVIEAWIIRDGQAVDLRPYYHDTASLAALIAA